MDRDFVEFVRRRGDHHLRTAVLLTGDWHAAEDLTQASLGKLYRVWHRLDTSSDPDAYLRRILVNTHRSWWRSRWRREVPHADLPSLPGPDDMGETRAVAEDVRAALAKLPSRQRTALVLRFFADLPEAQVAGLMGCSVGAVKSHTHRGLRAMRRLLPSDAPVGRARERTTQETTRETPDRRSVIR
ncbi:SigE family RNA polymerase sigma factor [Planobispora siamensis]|uniref:RNA polymerase sigma24 factor n=1 Tax=Planobispora siamensis TaxID=936338 RepID=A0A8J3SB96_9ACTN|nr:SigE family RNA polymerase sigma factor [Planobispora siamensis]GIH89421.1 RNA polymerase sigma24 factor [Planobispora siamensis]